MCPECSRRALYYDQSMILLFNILSVATALLLAYIHKIAVYNSLYWNYLWFDIPMHLLGGLTFGFWAGAVSLRMHFTLAQAALFTAAVVFFVSIVWEVFEFTSGLTTLERGFWLDTAGDIFFAVVGALLAYFLFLLARWRTASV